ncbi:GNAT family N-acetyltransferase [Paenibacillus sp. MMO-58]|uniref:GNAT family N-acetyltransferase n=1 Tax=Paenibacillus sp. MMO-58 TaxID=3081290 RepID=UPI00301B3C28
MMQKQVLVREATAEDRDAVRDVLLDAYGQYANTLSEERWEQYKENIVAAASAGATKNRLVAELDGRIVGSVFLFESSEQAYGYVGIHTPIIRLLAVSQEARGHGVATQLIRESAGIALASGAELLHLHTSDMMDSAVRLYERLGFERAKEFDVKNGETLVKSYRLRLRESAILNAR